MNLVDIGFLGSELDVISNFFANRTEEGIVNQGAYYAVLVWCRDGVLLGVIGKSIFGREVDLEAFVDLFFRKSYRKSRCVECGMV